MRARRAAAQQRRLAGLRSGSEQVGCPVEAMLLAARRAALCRAAPAGALRRPFSVAAGEVSGLPAVVLSSDEIEVGVLTGGGHIASIRAKNLPSGVEDVNPLWQPPWQTSDPSLRRLLGPAIGGARSPPHPPPHSGPH